eukprot:9492543-Pyramimonas_sp.AAC.1
MKWEASGAVPEHARGRHAHTSGKKPGETHGIRALLGRFSAASWGVLQASWAIWRLSWVLGSLVQQ